MESAIGRSIGRVAHVPGMPRERRQPGRLSNIRRVEIYLYQQRSPTCPYGLSGVKMGEQWSFYVLAGKAKIPSSQTLLVQAKEHEESYHNNSHCYGKGPAITVYDL